MKKTRICKIALLLLCCVLVLANIPVAGAAAGTFSGNGKGTKADPYIVKTAQQLDEMRNDLKAYYKLGDTIDLSSVANFKPIGTIAKPFTGSFTCDANADGTPKYIIKNLTIINTPVGATLAEKYSGYKDDGTSGWETALFGCANGSTFKNIVILDANIKSTVEGRSGMNADWSLNPGMDDQPTAVLLGIGTNVTVTGCGASGKIESASNGTGGLISTVKEKSTVSHSYSYVDINCTGAWNSGGFIASVGLGSEVKYCFYDGNFRGGATEDGAFFGVAGGNWDKQDNPGKVHDCWAAGKVLDESSGCFGGAQGFSDYATRIEPYTYVYNTYTLATIEGRTKAQTNKKVTNNNYITDQPGGFEIGYAAASQAEINAAFKDLSGWVVTEGTYPQIKGLTPVRDASAYVPGAAAPEETAPVATEAPTVPETNGPEATAGATVPENTVPENTLPSATGGENAPEEGEDTQLLTEQMQQKIAAMTAAESVLAATLVVIFAAALAYFVYTVVCTVLYLKKRKDAGGK